MVNNGTDQHGSQVNCAHISNTQSYVDMWMSLSVFECVTFSFGSQFLITTSENLDYLDGVHTVFGEVTEGMDVLSKINEAFVDTDFIPFQDIR